MIWVLRHSTMTTASMLAGKNRNFLQLDATPTILHADTYPYEGGRCVAIYGGAGYQDKNPTQNTYRSKGIASDVKYPSENLLWS